MEDLTQIISDEIRGIINEIISGINSGETVIFCGAGISRNSGLPLVNQLAPYILNKLEIPDQDAQLILDQDHNPRIPFEAFIQGLQENSKIEGIFKIYDLGEPNTNHILLAKLIKSGKLQTIITTNFDKLIERALSMAPKAFAENKDYDVIYNTKDFENINWSEDRIRLIKIHGSVDDKESMAITLKQVASHALSNSRMAIINEIFSKGGHSNVIILGYSSSDIFDISLHIQAIDENYKKVYYIQHADKPKVENIQKQTDKNPFRKFKGSLRLYFNTSEFIEHLWNSTLGKHESYIEKTGLTLWNENVDEWYKHATNEITGAIRYIIPANIYLQIAEYETALRYYEEALKVVREIGNKQNEEICLGNIALVHLNSGKYKSAIVIFEQALEIAKEIGDKQKESQGLGGLGVAFYHLGDYNEAVVNYEKALKIAQQIGDKQNEGVWLSNLGAAYGNLGQYRTAISNYEQALKIAQEIGDKNNEGAYTGSLGMIYYRIGDYEKAIENYKQALIIAEQIGDKQEKSLWLGELGTTYGNSGDIRKAIINYELAQQIAQDIGDKQGEGLWLGNLGRAYGNLGELEKAIAKFEQAIVIAQDVGDKQGEGLWLGNLGTAYWNSGENIRAIESYEKALEISHGAGDKQSEGLWLGNLGIVYDNLGEFQKATEYYSQALDIFKLMLGAEHPHTKWLENSLQIIRLKFI